MTQKKNPKHYVDNAKFSKVLGEWAQIQRERISRGEKREKVPEYVGECIMKICNGLSYKPNFMNYPFKEEMIGDAMEIIIKYIINFDLNKTNNAFAYISQIAYYTFIRRIQKEKKTHMNHLSYISNEFNLDEISSQLGDSQEYYQTYLDDMRGLLDTMDIKQPQQKNPPKRKQKKEIPPGLLDYME